MDRETTTGSSGIEKNGVNGSGAPRRRNRVVSLCIKLWWLFLFIFIAIVLIVVLCVVYVGFPHIAQSDTNDSTIELVSLVISDPTPTSFRLVQDAISKSSSSYHPWLDSFNVSTSLAGASPYAMYTVPGLTNGDAVPVHVDQVVAIDDVDAFTAYNIALLNSESIQQRINGSTWLHEGSLPATDVSYDKTLTVTGFNGFKGFNLTAFHLITDAKSGEPNMNGSIFIPNPSRITVSMGNVTFNTYVADELIGNTTVSDFVLTPGSITYPITGYVDTLAVFGLLTSGNYSDHVLPLTIKGNSSIYNGEHLTYFEQALISNVQNIDLNITAALSS